MSGVELLAAAALAGGVASAGATLASKPSKPKPVQQKTAPTADDKQVDDARRRRAALARQTSGVASTVLTRGSRETLGG